VITNFGVEVQDANDVLVQPDGRIVAAGFAVAADGFSPGFALARYNSDGSLDPTFGVGGTVITDLGGFEAADDVVLQPSLPSRSRPYFGPGQLTARPAQVA
jgi:uncharacterized delta-60 repeat protein